MFIPIPTGARYTAQAWGGVVKEVTCAHCGTLFVYEMRRMVHAESSAPAFVGMKSAEQRAMVGAEAELLQTLATDHDLIACPKCGRLQPAMNWIVRKRWMLGMIVVWVGLLLVALFGYMGTPPGREPAPWTKWMPAAATVFFVAGMVTVFLTEFRAAATDRAQLKSEAEAQGYARLRMPRVMKEGWIWVRATLFEPPEVCANCGGVAERTLRRKLGAGGGLTMSARVCGDCYRNCVAKRVAWGAVCVLAPVALGAWWVLRDPRWDAIDLVIALVAGAVVGGVVLAVGMGSFLGRAGMPVRFRRYRGRQDSVEVKFKSEKAAEEFLARAVAGMMKAGA